MSRPSPPAARMPAAVPTQAWCHRSHKPSRASREVQAGGEEDPPPPKLALLRLPAGPGTGGREGVWLAGGEEIPPAARGSDSCWNRENVKKDRLLVTCSLNSGKNPKTTLPGVYFFLKRAKNLPHLLIKKVFNKVSSLKANTKVHSPGIISPMCRGEEMLLKTLGSLSFQSSYETSMMSGAITLVWPWLSCTMLIHQDLML